RGRGAGGRGPVQVDRGRRPAPPSAARRVHGRHLPDRPGRLAAADPEPLLRPDVPHVLAAVDYSLRIHDRDSRPAMTFPADVSVRSPRPRLTAQVMFGFLIIVLGVLFTLDNLELIDARDYIQYWPDR